MSSTKKNLMLNFCFQILNILQPLILSPYISRAIGAEALGVYSYTHSIALYFVLFGMLGVNNYGKRSIAKTRDDKEALTVTFWSIYSFQVAISLISLIMFVTYTFSFHTELRAVFLIQSLYVLSGSIDINWFFFGMENFKISLIRNAIVKVLTIILIFVLVKDSNDLLMYTFLMSSSLFLSQITLIPYVFKYVKFKIPKFEDMKSHLFPNLKLFIPVIAISIYSHMDRVMLGSIRDMREVGIYENSTKFITISHTIIATFNTVMLPKISNLVSRGDFKKSENYIDRTLEVIILISSLLAFGLAAVGPQLAALYFGVEFTESGYLFRFLAPTIVFMSWASVIRTQYLIPYSRDNVYIYSVVLGAAFNLIINFLLINRIGIYGAAIGTVIAEFSVAFVHTWFVKNDLPISKYFKNNYKYIISGILMYTIIQFADLFTTNPSIISLGIISIIGFLTFILSVLIMTGNLKKILLYKY